MTGKSIRILGDGDLQAIGTKSPIQDFCAVLCRKRSFNILLASFLAEKGDASAAAGAADLRSDRSVIDSGIDKKIHMRRRDVR